MAEASYLLLDRSLLVLGLQVVSVGTLLPDHSHSGVFSRVDKLTVHGRVRLHYIADLDPAYLLYLDMHQQSLAAMIERAQAAFKVWCSCDTTDPGTAVPQLNLNQH